MTAGRFEGVFFADQWRTMHHTIEARIAAGDAGVSEMNVEPELPPPATNQPPLANAGGDMRTTGPAELVLDGSASGIRRTVPCVINGARSAVRRPP